MSNTFPVYLLSGQLIFNFYNEATTSAMGAIIDNGPLIKKIYVPKYVFVLSRIFSSSINLAGILYSADFCDAGHAGGTCIIQCCWCRSRLFFIVFFSLGVG